MKKSTNNQSFTNNPPPSLGYLRREDGLTLIELMIVVAIIGVLSALAMPYYQGYVAASKYTVAITNLQTIDKELRGFNILNDAYPDSLAEIGLGSVKDPWGNTFKYLNVSNLEGKTKKEIKDIKKQMRKDHSLHPVNTDFDLYSMGPDGKTNRPFTAKASRDDIVRANNGAFLGSVSDY